MAAPAVRIVGIGASAGGLESLTQLFDELAPDTGMAFLVVQHLSPEFPSLMDELIARHTDMPVALAEHGAALAPDRVYLMPPGKEMIVHGGRIALADRIGHTLSLPIDALFRSLAHEAGDRAVAVVLSGAGSDGTRGIAEIKRAGGAVLVESARSAQFESMPVAAAATGLADHVLSPRELGRQLSALDPVGSGPPPDLIEQTPTRALLALLQDRFAIDFSRYKTTMVARRIQRRVVRAGMASLPEYLEHLGDRPDELDALYRDLLIGVTQFFRDPDAFDAIEREIVPRLLDAVPPGEPVRIWIAGCATGEEAYSFAMVFADALAARDRPLALHILATDVHPRSLAFAAEGIYPADQIGQISTGRLARYFVRLGDAYEASPALRKLIAFERHDVTRDPPPARMHLISCRNMLIYLQPPAYRAVLSLLHFALAPGGFLILGASEAPGAVADELAAIDDRWRLYQKRPGTSSSSASSGDPRRSLALGRRARPDDDDAAPTADSLTLGAYDQLLDLFMPPGFLIAEDRTLIDSFAGAERLLRSRPRRPSTNVLELLDEELRVVVGDALRRVFTDGSQVSYGGVPIAFDNPARCTVVARAIEPGRGRGRAAVVTFHDLVPESPAEPTPPSEPASREPTPVPLPAVPDPDTGDRTRAERDHLIGAHDQLIAFNEELQATNEELQSSNEQLHGVADDHRQQLRDLNALAGDLGALLDASCTAAILVDRELRIRRFSARIARAFAVQPSDLGRAITDLSHSLDRPQLHAELASVLATGTALRAEVTDASGARYLLRITAVAFAGAGWKVDTAPADGVVLSLTELDGP